MVRAFSVSGCGFLGGRICFLTTVVYSISAGVSANGGLPVYTCRWRLIEMSVSRTGSTRGNTSYIVIPKLYTSVALFASNSDICSGAIHCDEPNNVAGFAKGIRVAVWIFTPASPKSERQALPYSSTKMFA